MARRRRRTTRRSGGRSWLPTFLVLCAAFGIVLGLNVPADSFTSVSLSRGTAADVVGDDSGVIGIQQGGAGTGTTGQLVSLTNRFGGSATVTVRLTGSAADDGTLYVSGVNYGDAATLSGVPENGSRDVDLALQCDDGLVGGNFSYEIEVDSTSATGTAPRTATPTRRCIPWEDAPDWDGGSATGLVHDDVGDRNASDVVAGTPPTGNGLVAYWTLDEDSGTAVTDAAGSFDGTNNGASIGQAGVLERTSFAFDGSSDYVDVGSSLEDPLAGTGSLSFWIRTTQSGDDTMWQAPGVTGVESSGNGNDVFWGWIDSSGNIGVQAGDTAGAMSTTSINDDAWHHVVLTRDASSGEVEVYVDGTLEDTATSDTGVKTNPFSSLGRVDDTGGSPEYFSGNLDEVRVYDRVVDGSEVDALYEGTGAGGTAWSGRLTTAWESTDGTLDPGSLYLDGVNANVSGSESATVYVESDPDGDGTVEETSDAITLNASTGPYDVNGLSTASDRFRLRFEMDTTTITESPCVSSAVLTVEPDLVPTPDPGCARTVVDPNQAPSPSFTYSPSTPTTGIEVSFDASGSTDPDGTIGTYQWDFDGDGLYEVTKSVPNATHRFDSVGTYTVTLKVIDDDSAANTTNASVTVGPAQLIWEDRFDWDSKTSEASVVHEDFGDHNASWVEPGYANDSSGLVTYLPLDEDSGTVAVDATGNGHDASGSTGITRGQSGLLGTTSYEFDGSSGQLEDADGESYVNGLTAFTLSAWVNADATGTDDGIVIAKSPDGADDVFGVRYDADGFGGGGTDLIKAGIDVDGTTVQVESASGVQTTGWQHVVLTWQSGGQLRIYVDGTETTPTYTSGGTPTGQISGATTFLVGQGAKSERWDGRIDEVRLYDTALGDAAVQRLYEGTNPAGGQEWNGTHLAGNKTISTAVDPTGLELTNVAASVPAGTSATAWVESDPDGDGTFQERSGAISINGTASTYDVPNGSLSTASGNYRIRLHLDTTDRTVAPSVDWIEIDTGDLPNQPPTVTVDRPDGGEVLAGGASEEIRWTASDTDGSVAGVDLAYSTDGSTWTAIATNETNDGSYDWTVPSIDSSTVIVRATATDDDGATDADQSDATFEIDSTTPTVSNFAMTNPAGETLDVSFDSDESLATVQVDVEFSNGSVATTLSEGDFAESGGTYTASYTAPVHDNYTAILVTAADAAGNDGASGQTDTANVNDPPTADFTWSRRGNSNNVDVDGSPSSDPDGSIVTYQWDVGADGTIDATGQTATISAPDGTLVRLTVTDDDNATASETSALVGTAAWFSTADWDASAGTGVVHESVGDRVADRVRLGHPASDSGQVAYWPLDEDSGTTAVDAAGSNDGTYQNSPTLGTAGLLGTSAVDLDGSADHVVVPDDASLEMSDTDAVTVSAWVNKDSAQSGWIAILQHSDQSYNLQFETGDVPAFTVYDGGWNTASSGTSVNTGQWYHLVGTFDGSTITMYVDGTQVDTASASAIADAGGQDVGIGENLDATGRHLDARIDDVRVYDRALSSGEVSSLYQSASTGELTTGGTTYAAAFDPTTLELENVTATVPSSGTLTVYVQSDPDGDGTYEEESAGIQIADGSGTGPYSVGGGTLSSGSADYRLRITFDTSDQTQTPVLDRVELAP